MTQDFLKNKREGAAGEAIVRARLQLALGPDFTVTHVGGMKNPDLLVAHLSGAESIAEVKSSLSWQNGLMAVEIFNKFGNAIGPEACLKDPKILLFATFIPATGVIVVAHPSAYLKAITSLADENRAFREVIDGGKIIACMRPDYLHEKLKDDPSFFMLHAEIDGFLFQWDLNWTHPMHRVRKIKMGVRL